MQQFNMEAFNFFLQQKELKNQSEMIVQNIEESLVIFDDSKMLLANQ